MKFNTNAFALAVTGALGTAYIVCSAFFALWPKFGFQLHSWMVHLTNVSKYEGDFAVTMEGFLWGTIQVVVYAYIVAWIFAYFYNSLVKE